MPVMRVQKLRVVEVNGCRPGSQEWWFTYERELREKERACSGRATGLDGRGRRHRAWVVRGYRQAHHRRTELAARM